MSVIKRLLVRLGVVAVPLSSQPRSVAPPAPHEQYPEILHWKVGDEIRNNPRCPHVFWFNLISITSEGQVYDAQVYGQNCLNDHKCSYALWVIMRDGSNLSLQDRQINETLKESNDYMELIEQFNVAFAELQERDRKLKLVS